MPKQLINNYYNSLHKAIQFGGSRNETSVRHSFINLINSYAEKRHLLTEIVETVAKVFTAKPRTKLKADKTNGTIEIDTKTTLTGVPPIAWEYKLGNRSALEWILDQYKERKPSDATIAEKFNTYKFEDYKEQVIDLLRRVCTVSVKTMEIIGKMKDE